MPEVVELYVVMYCEACAASVKRVIKKIPGVESYKIDYYGQKVTVVGNVDRVDVWRRIHKTGRSVTLIDKPAPPPKEEEKKKEIKKEEKKEETKKEEITETKVEEKTTTETVTVEEQKIEETTVGEEVKVHEVTEEVVTVVEITEGEETKEETKTVKEEQGNKKKEPKKPKPEPEWVPMFVCAPYYTLPSTFYN